MATYVIDVDTGTTYLADKAKKAKKAIAKAGLEKALLCCKNAKELAKQLTNQELVDCYVEVTGEQPPKCDSIKELAEELADALALERLPAFDPAKHCTKAPTATKSKATAKKKPTTSSPTRQRSPRPIDGIPYEDVKMATFERGDGAAASRGPMRKLAEELDDCGVMDYEELLEFHDDDEEQALKVLRGCVAKDTVTITGK